ncbi:GNAT family N-acetyltransferase [Brevundimonas aveniformis]|uniref:GNAT family N-acetyltransferase n=1 Tax=Brevundimonas aveniformis TaxID=370977 RepID=UPI00249379A8|nr:GNAT family N-acetyltransferase [Brevundimonas aveniformis]
MTFDDVGLTLTARTSEAVDRADLKPGAEALFRLFLQREPEFGFNPDITVDYPEIDQGVDSPFLDDAPAYLAKRLAELAAEGRSVGRVVILTTWADRVGAALTAAGWTGQPIDMPAGPDGTWTYALNRSDGAHTLYVEAVNEADPKIRPDFLLELHDADGRLRGGAWGSIHDRDGQRYAYLATMTLDEGLPPGVGTALGQAVDAAMRQAGVGVVHLGTQTAGPFYRRLGYRITHNLVPGLRVRTDANGQTISTDLVMMERRLADG